MTKDLLVLWLELVVLITSNYHWCGLDQFPHYLLLAHLLYYMHASKMHNLESYGGVQECMSRERRSV